MISDERRALQRSIRTRARQQRADCDAAAEHVAVFSTWDEMAAEYRRAVPVPVPVPVKNDLSMDDRYLFYRRLRRYWMGHLKPAQFHVLYAIVENTIRCGWKADYVTSADLRRATRMTEAAVLRTVDQLVAKGVLVRRRRQGHVNRYYVVESWCPYTTPRIDPTLSGAALQRDNRRRKRTLERARQGNKRGKCVAERHLDRLPD